MRGLIAGVVAVAIGLVMFGPGAATAQAPFATVTIGDASYLSADALAIASRIPKNAAVRLALAVARKCNNLKAFGFVSTRRLAGGVVVYAPASLSSCFGVSGGGPSRPSFSPCFKTFRTPTNTDPLHVSGGRGTTSRVYVLIAGTDTLTCVHLSTQVPGGIWSTTAFDTAAGNPALVKCQRSTDQGLYDYIAPYSTKLPSSKRSLWIQDRFVQTGVDRLANVPSC